MLVRRACAVDVADRAEKGGSRLRIAGRGTAATTSRGTAAAKSRGTAAATTRIIRGPNASTLDRRPDASTRDRRRGPPPFPVADGVKLAPLNALGDKGTIASHDSFVVVGAGKSGVDAVCHLLDEGIAPDKVTWVVSNDVWYFIRDGMFPEERGGYFAAADRWFACTLKKTIRSAADLFLEWEKLNIVGRVPLGAEAPTIFKGATIDSSQLVQLRSVQAVRLGRITEVTRDEIILEEGRVPLAGARVSTSRGDAAAIRSTSRGDAAAIRSTGRGAVAAARNFFTGVERVSSRLHGGRS